MEVSCSDQSVGLFYLLQDVFLCESTTKKKRSTYAVKSSLAPFFGSVIIQDCSPEVSLHQVYKWLELSIQFYVTCATAHNSLSESFDTRLSSAVDNSILAEVLDDKGPWMALHELFYLAAKKCGWIDICKIYERLDPKKYKYVT